MPAASARQDPVNRPGNHVVQHCGEAWVVRAHIRLGSMADAPDETIATELSPAKSAIRRLDRAVSG